MSTTPDQALLTRIATLEAENSRLRNALQARDIGDPAQITSVTDYERLLQTHQKLQKRCDEYQQYVKRATEKYRAAKELMKKWQEFYDHHQRKVERLRDDCTRANRASSPAIADVEHQDPERTPRPPPARNGIRFDDASSNRGPRDGEAEVEYDGPRNADEAAEPPNVPVQASIAPDDDPSDRSSENSAARAGRVTSSQTTEDGPDLPVASAAPLNSDDDPEFVSARPAKRMRGKSSRTTEISTHIKQERTSPSQPHEINSEDYSSPVSKRRQPLRGETSNLDAVMDNLDLPEKPRRSRALSAEVAGPPRLPTMTSSLSEGGAVDAPQMKVKEEPLRSPVTTRHAMRRGTPTLPPKGSDISDRALRPLSTNVAASPQQLASGRMKRKRNDEGTKTSATKAAIVSEDGDMDSSQVNPTMPKTAFKAAASRRLDSLLDETTPGRQQVARPDTTALINQTRRQRELLAERLGPPELRSLTPSKKSPFKKQVAEQRPVFKTPNVPPKRPLASFTGARGRSRADHSPPPPDPDPEDEPLRARPFIRLCIEDFKINPKYKGTDFAFADTLRGRDQRRCLPGCTRPECCGDAFRKAAEMGVRGSKTDDEVLEAYLGPNFVNYMASRSPAERTDVLIKARTYAIASEHGKHRQAFKRHTTPPGFWRIDMPSTQEEEHDRAKAQELGRQEVYDRWREAMVPGGRWKFRDE